MISKYFGKLQKIPYDMYKNGNTMEITDIFTNVRIFKNILENDLITYEYYIQEGDTPEMIADAYYGNPFYHWIILLTNNIRDVYAEWPMDYAQFRDYLNTVYADNEEKDNGEQRANQKIHHYEDFYGNIIHKDTYLEKVEKPGSEPPRVVTYLQHEVNENNRKRVIKILNNEYLEAFLDEFQKLLDREEI